MEFKQASKQKENTNLLQQLAKELICTKSFNDLVNETIKNVELQKLLFEVKLQQQKNIPNEQINFCTRHLLCNKELNSNILGPTLEKALILQTNNNELSHVMAYFHDELEEHINNKENSMHLCTIFNVILNIGKEERLKKHSIGKLHKNMVKQFFLLNITSDLKLEANYFLINKLLPKYVNVVVFNVYDKNEFLEEIFAKINEENLDAVSVAFDVFVPKLLNEEFSLIKVDRFWHLLQQSILNNHNFKQAAHLLQKCIGIILDDENMDNANLLPECVKIVPPLEKYRKSWSHFFTLLHIAEEKQLHLVAPSLKLLNLLNDIQPKWLICLYKILLNHSQNVVVYQTGVHVLQNINNLKNLQDFKCVIGILLRAVNRNEYSAESNMFFDELETFPLNLDEPQFHALVEEASSVMWNPITIWSFIKVFDNTCFELTVKLLEAFYKNLQIIPHKFIRESCIKKFLAKCTNAKIYHHSDLLKIIDIYVYQQQGLEPYLMKIITATNKNDIANCEIEFNTNYDEILKNSDSHKVELFLNAVRYLKLDDLSMKLTEKAMTYGDIESLIYAHLYNNRDFCNFDDKRIRILSIMERLIQTLNEDYVISDERLKWNMFLIQHIDFDESFLEYFNKAVQNKYHALLNGPKTCNKKIQTLHFLENNVQLLHKSVLVDWFYPATVDKLENLNEKSYVSYINCYMHIVNVNSGNLKNTLEMLEFFINKSDTDTYCSILNHLFNLLKFIYLNSSVKEDRNNFALIIQTVNNYLEMFSSSGDQKMPLKCCEIFVEILNIGYELQDKWSVCLQNEGEASHLNNDLYLKNWTKTLVGILNKQNEDEFFSLIIYKFLRDPHYHNFFWLLDTDMLGGFILDGVVTHKSERNEHEVLVDIIMHDISQEESDDSIFKKTKTSKKFAILGYSLFLLTNSSLYAEDLGKLLLQKYNKNYKKRYFPDSHIHFEKLRIAQALLITQKHFVRNSEFVEELRNFIIDSFCEESHQPCVRQLFQWLLISLIENSSYEDIIRKMELVEKSQPSTITAFIPILYRLALKKEERDWFPIMESFVPWTMGANYKLRVYSQLGIINLYKKAMSKGYVEFTNKYAALFKGVETVYQSSAESFSDTIKTDAMMFESEYPTTETILIDIPRKNKVHSSEWFYYMLFFKKSPSTINKFISKTKPKISNVEYDIQTNIQTKILPWQTMLDGGNSRPDKTNTTNDLILIATLVDKNANLGGLSRTCEIFGVKHLVLSDVKVRTNKEFKSLSMSSENWVDVLEVKEPDLKNFLLDLKRREYIIIGAEQTAESVQLDKVVFPKKAAIFLGNEKEGIPAPLLPLLDICVEIPQFGVTRSLNVHVAGAMFIWEYVKQHNKKTENETCH